MECVACGYESKTDFDKCPLCGYEQSLFNEFKKKTRIIMSMQNDKAQTAIRIIDFTERVVILIALIAILFYGFVFLPDDMMIELPVKAVLGLMALSVIAFIKLYTNRS